MKISPFMTLSAVALLPVCLFASSVMAQSSQAGNDPSNAAVESNDDSRLVASLKKILADNPPPKQKDASAVSVWSKRADALFFLGQFPESVAAYEVMMEIDPALKKSHWRLGIAYFFNKQPDKAVEIFEGYHSFDDVDRENGIWRYLSQYQATDAATAKKELLKYQKGDREPFPVVYKLFDGSKTEEEVLATLPETVVTMNDDMRHFYIRFYCGMLCVVQGKKQEAVAHLQKAVACKWPQRAGYGSNYGWHIARLQLKLLQSQRKISAAKKYNVLFIISDDLTSTALSCYGNQVCFTPNIDAIADTGTRFTRAYCQGTFCGPSRASMLSGYYPHATGVYGYVSPRPKIGDRATWPQHFMNNGYHAARVSKIYHMGVPGGIEDGGDGADDPASWNEKFNSPGPEWKAAGNGETLENNPNGKKPAVGGNTFVVVEADGDDLVHSDGKTAAKAVQLIEEFSSKPQPFFLAVGFVRPHVPFVAPKPYYSPFLPYNKQELPPKIAADWDDIPKWGINYKTSSGMKMDERRQKKAVGGYYASVTFMDAQVGKVMDALERSGKADDTIVIFTSDHGYHLGEHDFWAKVSLHEESAAVPLIIKVPGKRRAVCNSLVELIDLYPTTASLCGLSVPKRLQGLDLSSTLDDSRVQVRDAAFSTDPRSKGNRGFLLRTDRWAYIQYSEDGSQGAELFDMVKDPKQYTNLISLPEYQDMVADFRERLAEKLTAVRANDL